MMCYRPTSYIMFSLKKLKFYGDRPEARGWGPEAGYEGWGPDNSNTQSKVFFKRALSLWFDI